MGKQTRRKKRRGGGDKKQQTADTSASGHSSSALIQRIRAPSTDARTRHAALTGLASSLLLSASSSSQGSSSKVNKKLYSDDLLDAVRERVALDDDVDCATAAAECLYFYVASEALDLTATAGWTLVLLQRLEKCKSVLSSPGEENSKRQKQQCWALSTSCLQTLCSLIETNPLALDRIQQGGESGSLIPLLLQLFILGRNELDKHASVAGAEQQDDAVRDATILSVRTLHSALDDNFELLQPFLHASAATSTTCSTNDAWEWLLTQSCHHVNLPMPARLHAAGCLVVCRQLLLNSSGSNVHPWLDVLHRHVLNTAIPLLSQCCDFHPDIAKALLSRYAQAQKDYQEEQDDYEMERDVIKTVNDRKEPARLIARRQKLMKEQQNEGDDGMQQHDDTLPARVNTQEVMERARAAWTESLRPFQLALEITANLTSLGDNTAQPEDEDGDNQNMDMDWGPDQEAELMAQQGGIHTPQQQFSPLDVALLDAIITKGLPDRLLACLKAVYSPLLTDSDTSIPRNALDDIIELQSKCAACLGNCFANLQSWKKNDCNTIWKELRCAKDQLVLATTEHNKTALSEEALCNAMMLGIRLRSDLRKCIGANDLDFILAWLSTAGSNDIKRDIVTMLGVLCCQEEHSAEVDRQVCSALLAALKTSKSAMLTSEILNSLMDMYGDDNHTNVFDELNVLAQFQRAVPAFQSLIQVERHDAPEDDVEQWRETALNASRFISYKKGQL
jgi:hypothetical protein